MPCPMQVRSTLGPDVGEQVSLRQLGDGRVQQVWSIFHDALGPIRAAGKMGMVIFQFHLSFAPTEANRQHVLW